MMELKETEIDFLNKFKELRQESGSHFPSIYSLTNFFPTLKIYLDACFLCNPYAYELFVDFLAKNNIQDYLKFYPPHNQEIAKNIAHFNSVAYQRILVGNGAIELIETILRSFKGKKMLIPVPTFSSYYEIAGINNVVDYYHLKKDKEFCIGIDDLIQHLSAGNHDVIILVNPNNPTATLIKKQEIIKLHKNLNANQTLIIDESFIHFVETDESLESYALDFENIIIIRSLSKDFGVAGVRIGYAILPEKLKEELIKVGYLWNVNGIAYFFSTLLRDEKFKSGYVEARKRYNEVKEELYRELLTIPNIKVYPSFTNFFIIGLSGDPYILFCKLLLRYGIYVRVLDHKIGLDGNFIRIASGNKSDNIKIIKSLKAILETN